MAAGIFTDKSQPYNRDTLLNGHIYENMVQSTTRLALAMEF